MITNGRIGDGPERMNEGQEDGAAVVPRAVEGVRRVDERLVALVQQRPVAALCAAALTGYVIGRVLTRLG